MTALYCIPDNFIPFHLDNCGNPQESPSGYFVDDLPALTFYSANKLIDLNYYLQAQQFINDKTRSAVLDVKKDILTAFSKHNKYTFNNNVRYFQTDTKSNIYTGHIMPTSGNDKFGIEVFRIWSGEYLTKCVIDYIDIDFGNTDDYVLYIEELNMTTTYNFTSRANQTVRIKTDYVIKSWSYNFYSNNSQDSIKVYILNPTNGTTFMVNQSGNYHCGQNCVNTDYFSINGYTNTEIPNSTTEMHGFNASISLQCDYDGLFCSILPYISDLIYYRLAYYIYLEACYTNRLNSITLDKGKLKELLQWSKDEYATALSDTLYTSEGWLKTVKSECIVCNSSKQYFSM